MSATSLALKSRGRRASTRAPNVTPETIVATSVANESKGQFKRRLSHFSSDSSAVNSAYQQVVQRECPTWVEPGN